MRRIFLTLPLALALAFVLVVVTACTSLAMDSRSADRALQPVANQPDRHLAADHHPLEAPPSVARFVLFFDGDEQGADTEINEVVELIAEHARDVRAARIEILPDPDAYRRDSGGVGTLRMSQVHLALVEAGLPSTTGIYIWDMRSAANKTPPAEAVSVHDPYKVEVTVFADDFGGFKVAAR